MLIALWIINALLALAFVAAGGMKLAKSKADLVSGGMAWAEDVSDTNIKLIGLIEVLGGLGLVLPLATGILPILAPIAAVGLTLVMVGAVLTHVRRKEAFTPAAALAVLSAISAVLGFIVIL